MYVVINKATQEVVGTYKNKDQARRARDRKDNAYGAYVHTIKGEACRYTWT